jgi:hypothetical protein
MIFMCVCVSHCWADFQKQYMLPAMIQAEEAQVFTFKQLQFATGNFSSANLIGPRGPYYSVYRGLLPDTNYTRPVAIKQLNRTSAGIPHSGELDREFRAEVSLRTFSHCPALTCPICLSILGFRALITAFRVSQNRSLGCLTEMVAWSLSITGFGTV